jgi:transposase-like protein
VGLREVAHKHSISRSLIRQWIQKYETGQLTDELDYVSIAEYEVKLAELERKVGQLTMEVDLLKGLRWGRHPNADLISNNSYCERPEGFSVARGCRTMKLARSDLLLALPPRRQGKKPHASA